MTMKVVIETPTGAHVFTGNHVNTKSISTTLRVTVDNQHVATFKNWTSWRFEEEGKSNA